MGHEVGGLDDVRAVVDAIHACVAQKTGKPAKPKAKTAKKA